ncbi:copper homeostasis protein [Luteimonas cucumeris]|uniref:PF03932 family protein CutC n=1 Tax=Luteimonas cucumeris TaxID=985012 RepID=A0A562L833_9GAMM|nr:copper homeostasis protein CutC [Luteimonas cucumeris]TWI03781.1 copper homeostasis protein [Luteimonas cucumeris]
MSRPLLEIAANSLASAMAAQEGGADRIELCENLGEGGTTPSHGTLAVTRERLRIPLYVLIRPRGGDFLYDDAEFEVMRRDIEHCVGLGCDGVVIGALEADGTIDASRCRELVAAAGTLGVTFHRAFDATCDQVQALQAIIGLGCERVLTSGACANALMGAANIAASVRQAGDRIRVMAGAGVDAANIGQLAALSSAHEFHASARSMRISAMRYRNPGLPGLSSDWLQTDVEHVRGLVVALHRLQ